MKKIYTCALIGGITDDIMKIKLLHDFSFKVLDYKDDKLIKFYTNLDYSTFDNFNWSSKIFSYPQKYICITKEFESNLDDYEIIDKIIDDLNEQINIIRLLTGETVFLHSIYTRFENNKEKWFNYNILGYKKTYIHPNMFEPKIIDYTNSKLPLFCNLSDSKLLMLALKYYLLSFDDMDENNAIVFLIIGLEILFSPADNGELTNRISRNCAVFLGCNKSECNKIYKDIKSFYNYRSKIVHTGEKRIKNKDWYDYLRELKKLQSILRYSIINYYEKIYLKNISHDIFLTNLNELGMGNNYYNCDFTYKNTDF